MNNFISRNGYVKKCRKCEYKAESFSELDMFPDKKDCMFGKDTICKECESTRKKADVERRGGSRKLNLMKNYGMTIEEYDKMLKEQSGMCKICKTDKPKHRGRFVVDHDHKTGKVRGLLCDGCNKGLGHFRDNIVFMNEAIKYIKDSHASA